MDLEFTADDIAEAARLNRKLDRLPRLRMQTPVGRVVLNGLLRLAELYPLLRPRKVRAEMERRTIEALGHRVMVRIFRPAGPCRGVVLDFHGGGWTIGNARMADIPNSELVLRTGLAVVSVDYQLALAASLDTVIEDCVAAMAWTVDHTRAEFGTDRFVVMGSSAGAHLAACALLRLRDRGLMGNHVAGAMLYFGLYDFGGTDMVRHAGADTLVLHGPTVRATLCKLTPDMNDAQRRDGSLSPLYADLSGLPPALFVVGTKDILIEDNERMAARWDAANGNAELQLVPESPHAFVLFGTAIARKVTAYVDRWLLERIAAVATTDVTKTDRCEEVA